MEKIMNLSELAAKVEALKQQGKTVVQSHGVFDLVHPGIIQHLEQAKAQGDVLVITVIRDKDVRRGPGRPIFNDAHRARTVASLATVDHVAVVDDDPPFDCVKLIKPDVFARGQGQTERDKALHDKIFEEERELYWGKLKLCHTSGMALDTAKIISMLGAHFPKQTIEFLEEFTRKYTFEDVASRIEDLKDLKVLLIGDAIVDEYHYCSPMGKSLKANLVVNRYLGHEVFPGGVVAVANHMAGMCSEVNLLTVLGPENPHEEFLRASLKPNVQGNFFYRADGPTVVKKRYLDQYLNQKLFEVNYLSDSNVDPACENQIISYLESQVGKYDIVVVSDFGHGVFTPKVVDFVLNCCPVLAVNTQTNGANAGFNLITRYKGASFVCLDEPEARFATQDKHNHIRDVAAKLNEKIHPDYLITTLGRRGSLGIDNEGAIITTPIFSSRVVDTVGAGDAFFSFTSLCFAKQFPRDLINFVGNAAGALAVQIVCNKKSVEKDEFMNMLRSLLSFKSWQDLLEEGNGE